MQPALIFENASVIDGTGRAAFAAEVALAGERIAAVAEKLPEELKRNVPRVDLNGKTLAPGFIDIHAHGELEPLADNSAASKVTGGVTTEISGNCGIAPFPLLGPLRERFEKEARDDYGWGPERLNWRGAGEYFQRLEEAGCAINRGFLAGHGALRAAVNGYGDNQFDTAGRKKLSAALEECLEAGCFGLSTGLVYPPGCFAPAEEIAGLAELCVRHGALYTTHMRSESDKLEDAIAETLDVCRRTGVRTQISHLKTAAKRNWHKIDFLEKALHQARRDGLDVHADRYPYIASSTGLDAVFSRWAYAGGASEEMKRLKDDATCARMEAEIVARNPSPDYWNGVQIAGVTDPALRPRIAGKTIAEIAAEWKMRPFDALRKILIEDDLRTSAIFFTMSEENLERIYSWDFVMVASDATARNVTGPTKTAAPHPRTFGTFPRALAKYWRERKVFSLEEAVRRMTGLPAEVFNLRDRGVIRPGAFADLAVFDPQTIRDEATYADSNRFSSGLARVYVNGALVVQDGKILAARPGKVLRNRK